MTPSYAKLLAAFTGFAGLLGLVSGLASTTTESTVGFRTWESPALPIDYDSFARSSLAKIAQSPLFGEMTGRTSLLGDSSEAETDDGLKPFPRIRSAVLLDGQPEIYLQSEKGDTITAGPGDEIEGGWKILAISLRNVTAVQGDVESVFPIFPAADQPADETQDG